MKAYGNTEASIESGASRTWTGYNLIGNEREHDQLGNKFTRVKACPLKVA